MTDMISRKPCTACRRRGQTWVGDPPRCAFPDDGAFVEDNWNCATAGLVRDLVDERWDVDHKSGVNYQYCEDQKYATVKIDDVSLDERSIGLTLWVTWYKNRGRTEQMWILDSYSEPRRPNVAEVQAIVARYGRAESRRP